MNSHKIVVRRNSWGFSRVECSCGHAGAYLPRDEDAARQAAQHARAKS